MSDVLSEETVRAVVCLPTLVDDIVASFTQPTDMQATPRWSQRLPNRAWLGISRAASRSRGAVLFKISTERLDGTHAVGDSIVTLSAASTGSLLAVLEAEALTQFRTAAVTVAVARCLGRVRPRRITVIGSGKIAQAHVMTLRETVAFEELTICARDADAAYAMIERARAGSDHRIRIEHEIRCAVADSQLVITATSAREPFLRADWLAPNAHVAAVGAYDATTAELHEDVFARADAIFVDDREGVAIAGDVAAALDARVTSQNDFRLPSLYLNPSGMTLWKSVGAANHDLIAAWHVWRNFISLRDGSGTPTRQVHGRANPIALIARAVAAEENIATRCPTVSPPVRDKP